MAWEARKKEGFFLILSCIHYYIGNQNMAFIIFFTAVYNQERLILQTIYVSTKQGNSSIKSSVCNQERVIMARVWYIYITTSDCKINMTKMGLRILVGT